MTTTDHMLACHAAGMTVPETAAKLNCCPSLIYRWAKQRGLRFHNRKVPPPKVLRPESEAKRRAAHARAMDRIRNSRVNGWTWAELLDLGYTARQAAKLRGQTIEAAYKAQEALGRDFYRIHLRGLTDQERRRLSERERLIAQVKRDPEAMMLAMMRMDAERRAA